MKKRWVLMLAGFVFCAAMAFAQGTPITGEWSVLGDTGEGGLCTGTMTQVTVEGQPAYRFQGEVKTGGAVEWPYLSGIIEPDAASVSALSKIARNGAITFKIRGDGQKYWFVVAISDVKDYGYHRYSVQTKAGETVTVRVPVNQLRQPDWALRKTLNFANAVEMRWDTFLVQQNGPFDVTVWDLRFE